MNDAKKILQESFDSVLSFAHSELTCEEIENFLKEMETISRKFKNGYYKSADFVPSNQYHHKSRTSELYDFFSGYYERSKKWAKLFCHLPPDSVHTVMDLCPGWSPKIEFALRDWGFKGKLYVLDSDLSALHHLQNFLEMINVSYHTELLHCNLFSPSPVSVDLLVGNHLLDDIFLEFYCQQLGYTLEQIYDSESLFKKITDEILFLEKKESGSSILEKFIERVDGFINIGGYAAFLHYPGKLEKGLGLYDWIQFIYALMEDTRQKLLNKGYECIVKGDHHTEAFDDGSQVLFLLKKQ